MEIFIVKGGFDLCSERAAVGVEILGPVHDGQVFHMGERLGDLLSRKWTEESDLQDACFDALLPELIYGVLGGSCCGADQDHGVVGVLQLILFKQAVFSAGDAGKFFRHIEGNLFGVAETLHLCPAGFHDVVGHGVRAVSDGFAVL